MLIKPERYARITSQAYAVRERECDAAASHRAQFAVFAQRRKPGDPANGVTMLAGQQTQSSSRRVARFSVQEA